MRRISLIIQTWQNLCCIKMRMRGGLNWMNHTGLVFLTHRQVEHTKQSSKHCPAATGQKPHSVPLIFEGWLLFWCNREFLLINLICCCYLVTASVGQWTREPALQLDQHWPSSQPPQEEPVWGDGVAAVRHALGLQPQQQGAISGPAGIPAGAFAPPARLQRHHLSPPWPLLRRHPPHLILPQWSGRGGDWGGDALCSFCFAQNVEPFEPREKSLWWCPPSVIYSLKKFIKTC